MEVIARATHHLGVRRVEQLVFLKLVFIEETGVALRTRVTPAWGVGGRRADGWRGLRHPLVTTPDMWRGQRRMRWLHMLLQRLESRVTFVTLWALDEIIGPYSSSARAADIISARAWGHGFAHAGSRKRHCGQTETSVPSAPVREWSPCDVL